MANEKKPDLTPEQAAAVQHRGSALLVSAAAGSGKTKVLVERLLGYVEQGDNIDDFLVITYTRAAAAELRERILDEISDRLAADPGNKHLRRQALLCRGAHISTIHAFCADILREYGHIAVLPPDFRVADDSESKLIKAEVLEDLLDQAYETINENEDFAELVDTMSAGRDDRRLSEIILDTHAKLQSSPDSRMWAEKQIANMNMRGVTDVSGTIWGEYLLSGIRISTDYWLGKMAEIRQAILGLPEFERAYGESVETTISGLKAFSSALGAGWDEARKHVGVEFPRPKGRGVSGYEELKDLRKRCKAAIEAFAGTLDCSSDEHIEDMLAVEPSVTRLLRLVLEFDAAYSAEKRRRGIADFADLEHMALSLLTGGDSPAAEISRRFREILVDEYQDVNAVQEMIFNAVSGNGSNIFMVGDVKQSIYRFRLADPSIFLEKYRSFKDAEIEEQTEDTPVKIMLSKNFRSRKGILDAVNFVFENIMSVEFGEMEYSIQERLVPGREDDGSRPVEDADRLGEDGSRLDEDGSRLGEDGSRPGDDAAVEIRVIDMSAAEQNEDEESPDRVQEEARYIAGRIAELTAGSYMIPDKQGGERSAGYSDIVILLRSMRGKANQYAAALSELGIPSDMPGSEGYFETTEISAALSLLAVIDNPMQDIPLAATLLGPVYGFTPDELAGIRAGSRGTDFYRALLRAAESNAKCASFLREIDTLRNAAPDMPADRFIHHVYNVTGLPGRVGAMSGGNKRRANLILLAEYAQRFEQSGYKGLFGFLTYIRGLREKGMELDGGGAEAKEDAVRIMSIHKSKGLEFPVVFLADTSKRFNNDDAKKPLLIHPALGPGAMRTDRKRRIEYTTLARMAVSKALTKEMLAEELRVLYVAMTRAREKLIITAAYRNAEKELEKLSRIVCFGTEPQVIEELKNMSSWIIAPILSGGTSEQTSILLSVVQCAQGNSDDYLSLAPVGSASGGSAPADADPDAVRALRERFNFRYPYAEAPDLPSKLTVTGLKGRYLDYEAAEDAQPAEYAPSKAGAPLAERTHMLNDSQAVKAAPFTEPAAIAEYAPDTAPNAAGHDAPYIRPGFIMEKTGLTAAERGTALHLVMQYADFGKCASTSGAREEVLQLAESGLLSREQAEAVNAEKITRFFDTVIGKRVLNAKNIQREFKFSLLYPAERFFPGGGEDRIMLQGVIDCFFEEDGELTVIDFKTDNVTAEMLEERVSRYSYQLNIYADALTRITGMPVKEKVIYFFGPDCLRTVP